jgi:hypothetical protein
MSLPISVTYTFATATSSIPLSELDANFTTVVNGINGIGNGTNALANVNITGGNATVSSLTSPTLNSSTTLSLQTGGTTGLYIDGSQNVGIGTSSPSYKLEVQGSANTYLGQRIYNTNSGSSAVSYLQIGNDSNGATAQLGLNSSTNTTNIGGANGLYLSNGLSAPIAFATVGSERMRIDSSGNVGIGTSSPGAKVDSVADSSSNAYRVRGRSSDSIGSVQFTDNGGTTEYAYVRSPASNTLSFGTGGSERARIDSSGNLLVGTTSAVAGERLSVTGSNASYIVRFINSNSGPYGPVILYPNVSPNGTGNQFLDCIDSTTTRFQVRSNGGVANYSANNVNLSDQREKKNIELAGPYLDKICAIPVKTFLFNDQTDNELNLGVIAQDVQAVAPELVSESNWAGKDEPEKLRLSIYQTDLQYAMLKAIQELKSEFDAYKASHP